MMNVGGGFSSPVGTNSSSSGANPQIMFVENFPGHLVNNTVVVSDGILSVHAVNIPVSISLSRAVFMVSYANTTTGRSHTFHWGLYSMNAGTLSLKNSASVQYTLANGVNGNVWVSMSVSAGENIAPGDWYFAFNRASSSGNANGAIYGNSSINPGGAIPGGFIMGRMTVSTGAMPASINTTALDITGSDAIRQPYVIITA